MGWLKDDVEALEESGWRFWQPRTGAAGGFIFGSCLCLPVVVFLCCFVIN